MPLEESAGMPGPACSVCAHTRAVEMRGFILLNSKIALRVLYLYLLAENCVQNV